MPAPHPVCPFLGRGTNTTIDPEWSKEETDYLFQIIEDYDSRFLIVHDRYEFPGGFPRSLEVRILPREDI